MSQGVALGWRIRALQARRTGVPGPKLGAIDCRRTGIPLSVALEGVLAVDNQDARRTG